MKINLSELEAISTKAKEYPESIAYEHKYYKRTANEVFETVMCPDIALALIRVARAAQVIANHYPDIEKSAYTASLVPYVALRKALKEIE